MRFKSLIAISVLGVGMLGCMEEELIVDENPTQVSSVEFASNSVAFSSIEKLAMIRVRLDKKSNQKGTVDIRLGGDAQHNQDYILNQIVSNGIFTLDIDDGDEYAEFMIIRLESKSTNTLGIEFWLENPSNGFVLGESTSTFVILPDLDSANSTAVVNFTDSYVVLSEGIGASTTINIPICGTVTQSDIIRISVQHPTGIEYDKNYQSVPAVVLNEIALEVLPGATSLSFQLEPVNDNRILGSYELAFTLVGSTQISIGSNSSLQIRIEEDDDLEVSVNSIAELRNRFDQSSGDFWLGEDYYIEGVITSSTNVLHNRVAYIQDGTAGIALMFSSANKLAYGTRVRLNLKDGSGQVINDQKAITGINDLSGVIMDEYVQVSAETISIEQLHTGAFEGKKVRIDGISFPEANNLATFLGSKRFSDTSGRSALLTTYEGAEFAEYQLPDCKVSVVGIVGDWGRLQPQVFSTDIIR
ncbi:hypothetical protein SAMN05421640_2693 [Ekhidna lutea]|uniref:DUF5689 domain-containing protein n=1 Tax=Ekhidna lutea TaxID=447679 RepID=A0A239KI48_EKHLU|nr:DUF5689 domain-containing protein [Ekhidna lutea]SNT18037.1 hypothetical protein SAMN05421640_2693 [Ekhidna lutea]